MTHAWGFFKKKKITRDLNRAASAGTGTPWMTWFVECTLKHMHTCSAKSAFNRNLTKGKKENAHKVYFDESFLHSFLLTGITVNCLQTWPHTPPSPPSLTCKSLRNYTLGERKYYWPRCGTFYSSEWYFTFS